ncbi:MAG: barstar family protein [Hymenobacter sp.]|nr:barstar family protein [Hymenobacter sp.]
MTVILEGSEMKSPEMLHAYVKHKLHFPGCYGNNLDALWDCLTTDVELPVTVKWMDFSIGEEFIGDYAQQASAIFLDAEKEVPGFQVEITAASSGQ